MRQSILMAACLALAACIPDVEKAGGGSEPVERAEKAEPNDIPPPVSADAEEDEAIAEALPEAAEEAPVAEETPAAAPARTGMARVSTPADGARVVSPLQVAGMAPNDWFSEGVFPLTLVASDGAVLAEFPAQPVTDWQVQGPVAFNATADFTVAVETQATLVLEEDMPPEGGQARRVSIPLVLAPAG